MTDSLKAALEPFVVKARELLAAEYDADGHREFAAEVKSGNLNRTGMGVSIRAIVAALRASTDAAPVADELKALIEAGIDEYLARCALRTEADGGFCHAYFYSDGQWRFQTGGNDITINDKTVRCLLTKRLYAHPPVPDAAGEGDRSCTCHPSERPSPCQHRYALTECLAAFACSHLPNEDRYLAGYSEGSATASQQHVWMQDKAWQDAVLMLVHYRTLAARTWLVGHEDAQAKLDQWWERAAALAQTKTADDIAALAQPPAAEPVGMREALEDFVAFAGEVAGTALGLAMSTDHPAPDVALMGLFKTSQRMAEKHGPTLRAVFCNGGEGRS